MRTVFHIIALTLIAAALLALPGAAGAQESTRPQPGTISPELEARARGEGDKQNKNEFYKPTPNLGYVFEQLPRDMQDELLAEMDQIHGICAANKSYSAYYDCDCIGVKFLDRRLMRGPQIGSTNLMFDVSKECVNSTSIAGHEFQRCLQRMHYLGDKMKERIYEMCECASNKYALAYAETPAMSIRYQMRMIVGAQRQCGYDSIVRDYNIDANLERAQRDNYLP